MTTDLVGKSHIFSDGNSLTVIQVKERDENQLYVTYLAQDGPGIPRKLVMPMSEFMDHYGHLFDLEDKDI